MQDRLSNISLNKNILYLDLGGGKMYNLIYDLSRKIFMKFGNLRVQKIVLYYKLYKKYIKLLLKSSKFHF